MIDKKKIEHIVEDYVCTHDLFVVEILVKKNNRIMVYVDSMTGLTIDECTRLSHHIESSLDREEEDFELEVSSPGLGHPLYLPQQYAKNLNRELVIIKNDGSKIEGILRGFSDEELMVEIQTTIKEGKKKQKRIVLNRISFKDIKQTKVKIVFKQIANNG